MPVTPDVIINKPRKFLHDLLIGTGVLSAILTAITLANGGPFFLFGITAIAAIYLGSKVKFKTVKTAQIDQYKRV